MVVATSCGPLAELHYVVVVMPWHTRAAGKRLTLCGNPFVSQSAGSRQSVQVSQEWVHCASTRISNSSTTSLDAMTMLIALHRSRLISLFFVPNFNPLIFKERQVDIDYDLCHSEASEGEILPPCKHDFGTSVTSVGLGRYFKTFVGWFVTCCVEGK